MECSICKENYSMTDDTKFLDDYMKLFVSLLTAVENNDSLEIQDIENTLLERRENDLKSFYNFMRCKIVEMAVEKVSKNDSSSLLEYEAYSREIEVIFKFIFDENSLEYKSAPDLLKYVRNQEEKMKEGNWQ